ncbi:acetate uptake transporter family protein [Actinomadura viridis]|uniref:acetate uptake transporter family protein n=1 Tax=Actinomadura viridis TaxID=58110 RepID=UPI003694737D
MTERREPVTPRGTGRIPEERARGEQEYAIWEDRTRVFLQPVAAPSILGLFGLAGATMMVGAWHAGWYGTAVTPLALFPFVLTFGGLAQLLAGMWSYRARDGLATAVHGTWGAFWLGWGLLFLLLGLGGIPATQLPVFGVAAPAFAFWFVVLTAITGLSAVAALGQNLGMSATLAVLTLGSAFTAAGFWAGTTWPLRVGGWMFVIAAAIALYTAAALMFENSFGRTILPVGKFRADAMGRRKASRPLEYRYGQPGVKIGQ